MKKIFSFIFAVFSVLIFGLGGLSNQKAYATETNKYFTVYSDDAKTQVLFLKGEDVSEGDMYLSHDNKLYEIESVDESSKTAIAKFVRDEELPKLNVKAKAKSDVKANSESSDEKTNNEITEVAKEDSSKEDVSDSKSAKASTSKLVGIYHTHNDECYYDPDGTDSIYGAGGIHDVGKALSENFNKLGVETIYSEDLHLPHNSGAYTRSQVTASELLSSGANAIFDIHRDAASRDYYLTTVNGEEMSYIRMVVGSASANYEENKNFAYTIKAYADEVYPGLIKDIYIGKGNYNQQLSTRAMLFEFGCENIEKSYAIKSSEYLAKTLDVVLYGSDGASVLSTSDASFVDSEGNDSVLTGIVSVASRANSSVNSNTTLWIVLGVVGAVVLTFSLVMIFSKKARYKVGRFFSEMFAGIFGKKKAE